MSFHQSFQFLQPFFKKCNESYFLKFVCGKHCDGLNLTCGLCECKFLNWEVHQFTKVHCKALLEIALQLIDVLFSPGIVFADKTKECLCIFCNIPLTNCVVEHSHKKKVFSDLMTHMNDFHHQEQVEVYKMKYEARNFNAVYEACRRVSDCDDENDLVKKLICNGIRLADNEKFECLACKFVIHDEEQFGNHITDSLHIAWAVNQLCAAVHLIQLKRGITIKNNGFFCLISDCEIGSGLDAAIEIPSHLEKCELYPIIDYLSISSSSEQYNYDSSPSEDECMEQSKKESSSASQSEDVYVIYIDDGLSSAKEGSSPSEDDQYMEQSKNNDSSPSEDECMEQSEKESSSASQSENMHITYNDDGLSSAKEGSSPSEDDQYMEQSKNNDSSPSEDECMEQSEKESSSASQSENMHITYIDDGLSSSAKEGSSPSEDDQYMEQSNKGSSSSSDKGSSSPLEDNKYEDTSNKDTSSSSE